MIFILIRVSDIAGENLQANDIAVLRSYTIAAMP
jgi:hypothetical protein